MGGKSRDKIVGGEGVDIVESSLKLFYGRSSLKSFQLCELLVVI
jgi:hypothetical protein